jgi:hypothetical protein
MRRATASGLIGLAILLCTPRPASAQWDIIKWLEGLSGPGDFWMIGGEVHLGCVTKAPATGAEQDRASIKVAFETGPQALRSLFCDQNPTPVKGAKDTGRQVWKDVKAYFTVAYAQSLTGNDPLDYPAGSEKHDPYLKIFTAGAAYRWNQWFDTGMAAGTATFTGSSSSSGNFNKLLLSPYVVVRPLARVSKGELQRLVSLKLDFLIFPEGFTDAEFGATGTKLDGHAELVPTFVVRIDFARFLGWTK